MGSTGNHPLPGLVGGSLRRRQQRPHLAKTTVLAEVPIPAAQADGYCAAAPGRQPARTEGRSQTACHAGRRYPAGSLEKRPAADDSLSQRDHAMLELLYSSGLRLAELVSLDLDSLDLAQGEVRVLASAARPASYRWAARREKA